MTTTRPDPITREVLHNGLLMATMEMKAAVVHTAYSPLWKESGDLSCGLLTARGEMVAQALGDIPIHLATMPFSLQGCLARIPVEELEPGDVLWQNDPYQGNNHLPDIFMAAPVFAGARLVGFSAVRGHFVDVGGSGPGSYSAAAGDLHAEGLRIPPMRLYRRGQMNQDVLAMFLANVRGPDERLGDLRAQYAGCHTGRRSLERLAAKYGAGELAALMEDLLGHSEALTRAQVRRLPRGRYEFTDHCDVAGEPIRLRVAVTVDGDRAEAITVDFTGSDPEVRNGMNAPIAVTTSATWFAIKCITDPENPANSGSYRPIRVIAPPGSVLNCQYPRPVVLSNHETAYRVVDMILGALAPAIPDRVVAAGAGTAGVFVVGGIDSRPEAGGRGFIYIDVTGAGQGAAGHKDGRSGIRVNAGNMNNTPVEAAELAFPILTLAYELAPDTGGAGTHRGSCALRRVLRVGAQDPTLTLTIEREHFPPYGLFGGRPGAPATVTVMRGGTTHRLPSKTPPWPLATGDVVTLQCAGGGGFGDPLQREPERVLEDVRDGYVSAAGAAAYGVAVRPAAEGVWIEEDATRRVRTGRESPPPAAGSSPA
jgi:N-methylhydantoinase B